MLQAEAVEHRISKAWKPEAGELDRTFVSPSAGIGPGEHTGRYRTVGDRLPL